MAWRYATASVTGTSHASTGTGCQDAHRCGVITDTAGNSVLAVVVSDGAGSALMGAAGSAIVTSTMLEQATAWLSDGGTVRSLDASRVRDWLDGVRENIANEAGTAGMQMRDYAATLLLALVDDFHSAFAQMGDGAIVTSDKTGEWDPEFWPQHGMFANQTYFVTDDGAGERLTFAQGLRPIRELAVFSDGLERVLLNQAERRAHPPAFEKMLQPLRAVGDCGHASTLSEALSRYLASTPVTTRTDDDVTLVIASRI